MNANKNISHWLDHQLELEGLSGKELANKIGVSEATISRIRNGRTPLSPRLKKRLSAVLNTNSRDIPVTDRHNTKKSVSLSILQPSTPDQAVINYAMQQGLFRSRGIDASEIRANAFEPPLPTTYISILKEQLAKRKTVVVVGPEPNKEAQSLKPIGSIFSHIKSGYHIVTRASTKIPTIEDEPTHKRLFALKLLFEHFEHADIWADNFNRFAWQSSGDLEFLKALRALSHELTGTEASPENNMEHRTCAKHGLVSLHDFGRQGSDFVIANATTLAEAYSNPKEYKVLFSLDTLMKTVSQLSADTWPALQSNLMKTYRADRATVAIERFKLFWTEKLSQYEVPIYWNIYCGNVIEPQEQQYLISTVADVLTDTQQALATPHLRDNMLDEIKSFCDGGRHRATSVIEAESFKFAWDESYSGL